jgi:mRNA interferase MazF
LKRAELYRVYKGNRNDPRRSRVFVTVSRQLLIDSQFSSVTCAPIYTAYDGLSTQVSVGVEVGLKHASSIHCDELVSIPKSALSDFVGHLSPAKVWELDRALSIALGLE